MSSSDGLEAVTLLFGALPLGAPPAPSPAPVGPRLRPLLARLTAALPFRLRRPAWRAKGSA
ncbi:hypothetical protein V5F49_00420 [Xanthobacter sp. V3C-3]|uniref:hypothetical protein n=1 Tax=Xanthobacter lutulentifluminis TaxID=3119935 RepID=UPI00372B0F62